MSARHAYSSPLLSVFPTFPPDSSWSDAALRWLHLLSTLFTAAQLLHLATHPHSFNRNAMLNPTSYPEILALIVGASALRDTFDTLRLVSRAARRIVDQIRIQSGSVLPDPISRLNRFYLLHACGFLRPLRTRTFTSSRGESVIICLDPRSVKSKPPLALDRCSPKHQRTACKLLQSLPTPSDARKDPTIAAQMTGFDHLALAPGDRSPTRHRTAAVDR